MHDASTTTLVILGPIGLWQPPDVRARPEPGGHRLEVATYHATPSRVGGPVASGVIPIVVALLLRASSAALMYLSVIPLGRCARHPEHKGRARAGIATAHRTPPDEHP